MADGAEPPKRSTRSSRPKPREPPAEPGERDPGMDGEEEPQRMGEGDDAGAGRRAVAVGRSLESETAVELVMENIVEKLKLLDYEKEFCRKKKPAWAPLNHTYFLYPSQNPNEQFFYFTSLMAWLLNMSGRKFATPGQFDDPNATCTSILVELKNCGFAPNFPPAKLKQGYGEAVCGVLDNTSDYVLEKIGFQWRKPVHKPDDYPEEAEVDDHADLAAEITETAMATQDENDAFIESKTESRPAAVQDESRAVLESHVKFDDWKLEMERVAPQLKMTVVADNKDWREHVKQAKEFHEGIGKSLTESRTSLERVQQDVTSALEKISTRENMINSQFEHLTQEYRDARGRLSDIQAKYNASNDRVTDLANELASLGERLEAIKADMDSRGNNISDTSPLVKIKQAIKQIKGELTHMERVIIVTPSQRRGSLLMVTPSPPNRAMKEVPSAIGTSCSNSLLTGSLLNSRQPPERQCACTIISLVNGPWTPPTASISTSIFPAWGSTRWPDHRSHDKYPALPFTTHLVHISHPCQPCLGHETASGHHRFTLHPPQVVDFQP
eukprot:jgi/Mesvir1/24546/Mv21884-RA.1